MAQFEPYKSIKAEVVDEITVKGSRFIAHIAPVASQTEAEDYVKKISKQYHDATHNCYAYKIGEGDKAIFKYSDDGEPSGTAGAFCDV